LYDTIGPGSHPCHWCETPVEWRTNTGAGVYDGDLVVDHLDGNDQNDELANLAPTCNRCNTLRALMNAWVLATGRDVRGLLARTPLRESA
jgi:hypothetical protein